MSKSTEKHLRDILRRLPEAQARTLMDFAEFLDARQREPVALGDTPVEAPVPENIPRPAEESVVKAIKRLVATYPMLDRSKMLNETSSLMTQHVMHGRDRVEVIDELEIVFRRYYEKLTEGEPQK
ncbi:MAG: Crp/Fnr family transcriptional regulator [Acidiferrobacterales bacterium]